jgi:hypothetical protein
MGKSVDWLYRLPLMRVQGVPRNIIPDHLSPVFSVGISAFTFGLPLVTLSLNRTIQSR